jgi:hypothetical protein
MLTGTVTVFASGNKAEIINTVKAHTRPFVDALRIQLDGSKPTAAAASTHPAAVGSLAELEKLVSLKERGLLSDEEFTAAKRKLLGL